MRRICLIISALCLVACGGEAPSQDGPPRLPVTELTTPLADPYDATRDANADVTAAFARAEAANKHVMLKFGGNWCTDCKVFAAMLNLPVFAAFMDENFEVVAVDVGRYERNMDIPARFGFAELGGVPTVLILEPDGTLINASTSAEWTNARDRDPQEVFEYFYRFAVDY